MSSSSSSSSSSSLTCTKLILITLVAISVQAIGLSLFVFGFFPVKPALSGHSGPESFRAPTCNGLHNQSESALPPHKLRSLYQDLSGIPPLFDKLVLMVIDGLPSEFVLGKSGQPPSSAFVEAMPYTQSLLANGMAIGYHAKAAPPTVTMPRLKAVVSGAIGGFLDVAFNFNTQALLDDNLLGQFLRIGWRMVMHGDETWLKLFPGLFVRHDGVSSFFVKDTVEVDQNVSRHLRDEISRDDWDLLVLHYLGLDHFGHIGGRNSVLMAPKLLEMDEVVKIIHTSTMQNLEKDKGRTLLVVISDHGMTENGNHGGSSYEETDSLALFAGLSGSVPIQSSSCHKSISQVDIAPTLALLYGVPIPKNNIGVLIAEVFNFLTDNQKLRVLELNSWQLFRLLQAQLPALSCEHFPCDGFANGRSCRNDALSSGKENMFCCLYLNATALHNTCRSTFISRPKDNEGYTSTIAAYHEFMKTASEWLSKRTTDKPVTMLTLGVTAMFISCLMLLVLVFHISEEVFIGKKLSSFYSKENKIRWDVDEAFSLGVILMVSISMLSSSMVEEEHYIWYFVTSTFNLLFLRRTLQSFQVTSMHSLRTFLIGQNRRYSLQVCSIMVLLFSGRILRGWHRGGVNWVSLPDISKWLEQAGREYIKFIQLTSWFFMVLLGLLSLSIINLKGKNVLMVAFGFLMSSLLVLHHIVKYQEMFTLSCDYANMLAQIIYASMGISIIIVVALPWIIPIKNPGTCPRYNACMSKSVHVEIQNEHPTKELKESLYVIGWAYIFFWCLLQFLLQQPINTMPVLLLLVQILVSMFTFSRREPHKQWIEIAALYYLGMAGHFALGNSNTLATVDVAGAFIGISRHSTLLSGILMFIITYASPMLFSLGMVMYISLKETSSIAITGNTDSGKFLKAMLAFPCLVPLSINSILLTVYTIVLLLMRNHLFIWSVFSPKYLYVCAVTVCVYLGSSIVAATVIHTYMVITIRIKSKSSSIRNDTNEYLGSTTKKRLNSSAKRKPALTLTNLR